MLTSDNACGSFIEENNSYKNAQKDIQRNQRMPPGMPSQDMMAYWGKQAPAPPLR
jgi:RAT1-interacting protein